MMERLGAGRVEAEEEEGEEEEWVWMQSGWKKG
jgi:hypothetical protein